ncbi:protein of unknown function [Paraburkholderia kururiensis]
MLDAPGGTPADCCAATETFAARCESHTGLKGLTHAPRFTAEHLLLAAYC